MAKKTYYDILHVTQAADGELIKAAYSSQMTKLFPEGNPVDQNDPAFKLLYRAYQVLSDPAKRAGYDAAISDVGTVADVSAKPAPECHHDTAEPVPASHDSAEKFAETSSGFSAIKRWSLYAGWLIVIVILHTAVIDPMSMVYHKFVKNSIVGGLPEILLLVLLIYGFIFINKRIAAYEENDGPIDHLLGVFRNGSSGEKVFALTVAFLISVAVIKIVAQVGGGIKQEEKIQQTQNYVPQESLGQIYARAYDGDAAALKQLNSLASAGNVEAQVMIGPLYMLGIGGIPQNYEQAFYWYSKAAEGGHADAQMNLASAYFNGNGVAKDDAQALYWYRKSADQGLAESQLNVAGFYFNGTAVQKDYGQAMYWYKLAANQGGADAQYMVGIMYLDGLGVMKDENLGNQWILKAANQGNAEARKILGMPQ